MKHDFDLTEEPLGRKRGTVRAGCTCGWTSWLKTVWNERDRSSYRRSEKHLWHNHLQFVQQELYYKDRKMAVVGADDYKEVWVANLHGDLPPGFSKKKEGLWQGYSVLVSQVLSGKLWPWLVFEYQPRYSKWQYRSAWRTEEEANLGASRYLGKTGVLGIKVTSYKPRAPSFEQHLGTLAKKIDKAKSPEQIAAMLKRLRRINAAFELVQQAELDMLKRMAGQ